MRRITLAALVLSAASTLLIAQSPPLATTFEVASVKLAPKQDRGEAAGPGLVTDDCAARANNVGVRFESPDYEEKARCGWSGINDRQRAVGVAMTTIAERLTMFMATPVSDRTGWPGLFTFDVMADTRDMPLNARTRPSILGAPLPVDAPQLLDVFRGELGLKLVKDRMTIDDFIVERVEPLIEN